LPALEDNEALSHFLGYSVIHKAGYNRVPAQWDSAMQKILRRELWTTTSSHEDKTWRRTQHTTQFIFKPYRVSIIRLYCSAMGRYRTKDSILSGGNGIETCFESLVQRFSSKLLLKGSSMSVGSRFFSTDVIALN